MPREEGVRHDDAEHRIPEELEAFVVRQASGLIGIGAMCQGMAELLGVHRTTGHLGEVIQQVREGPRRLGRRRGGRARHTGGGDQPWCSVRSAAS